MLVFEKNNEHSIHGDVLGESYSHLQSKLIMGGVTFQLKIPQAYSFKTASMKLTGIRSVLEGSQAKEIDVTFEKSKGKLMIEWKLAKQTQFETDIFNKLADNWEKQFSYVTDFLNKTLV